MAKSSTFVATLKFVDSFTKGFSKALSTAQTGTSKLNSLARATSNLGASFSNVGLAMTAGITMPIVTIGTKAVQSAMEVEGSINKIMTLQRKFASQGSIDLTDPKDVKRFEQETRDTIRNLSNTYGVAQTELAQSYYLLASAFNDTTHMEEAMNTATQMSIAGNVDAASSARLLATLYNAYGKSLGPAEDAIEHIGDVMAATVNFGFTEFPEIAETMGEVAPMAAQMGLELEDLAASMAVITSTGLSTAQSTTYLRNALKKATEQGDRSMFTDGGFLNYLETLKEDMPEIEQVMKKFKEMKASSGMIALLGNTDLYEQYYGEMKAAKGTLAEMTKTMSGSATRQFSIAMIRLSNILEKFGEKILPKVNDYMGKFADWLDKVEIKDEDIDRMIKWVGAAAAAGPALMGIGTGLQFISGFVGVLEKIATHWTTISTAVTTIAAKGSALIKFLGGLGGGVAAPIAGMAVGLSVANAQMNEFARTNPESYADFVSRYTYAQDAGITSNSTLQEVSQAYRNGAGYTRQYKDFSDYLSKNGIDSVVATTAELSAARQRYMSSIGSNATGSARWRGGLTTLNERGGEIVDLPTGSRIYPHDQSMKMGGLTINIPKFADTITIRNENDIDRFADAFANKLLRVVVNR